jgi:antitoxin component YwqK of YwqJK toxin-antitoxin module
MKNIICLLVIVFFISDCAADARVLEQLKAHAKASAKAKSNLLKNKKLKKKVRHQSRVVKDTKLKETIKPKIIVTKEDLDIRNDIAYLPNEDKPFTGKHEQYHSNGKKYIATNYKDGKKNGLLTMWDEYEHKIGQLNYIDGKPEE